MLNQNINFQDIPENSGIYYFLKNDKPVYFNFTADLQYTVKYLLLSDQEDVRKLRDMSDAIEWKETDSVFDALLGYKQEEAKPESQFRIYDNYVYLGLSIDHNLTCYVCDNTIDDYNYIGPFADRFKIYDFLYTIKELFSLKSIENNSTSILHEDNPYSFEFVINDKQKSRKLAEKLLCVRTDWISEFQMQVENHKDNLHFEKADLLERQLRLINKIRNSIEFCLITKHLDYVSDNNQFTIENGMLKNVNGKEFAIESSYKDNEEFAVSKDSFDERKVVMRYLSQKLNLDFSSILNNQKIKLDKIIYGG